jgi:hypothetical protein
MDITFVIFFVPFKYKNKIKYLFIIKKGSHLCNVNIIILSRIQKTLQNHGYLINN